MKLVKKFTERSPKRVADKAKSPEETIKLVEEKLKSAGIKLYKGVERVDKGRLGIPVYMSFYDADGIKITGKYKQMGKGVTEGLAKASAIMELVERISVYSFLNDLQENAVFTSFEKLGSGAIGVEELLSSVDSKEDIEVAKRVIPLVEFYFVKALDYKNKKEVYLPIHWFWILHEYNGCSAGNTYPEAGVQGLCEVIERHESSLVFKREPVLLELEGIGEEALNLIEKFKKLGVKLWLQDMRFDFSIPTIGAIAMDPSTFPQRSEIVYTAGTAPSPERALIRALTEVAQLAGDFDTEGKYEESGLPKFKDLKEAEFIINAQAKTLFKDLPDFSAEDHAEELETLVNEVYSKGFSVYFVDISHPALKIPAVYTVVPGARFRDRTEIPLLHHLIKVLSLYWDVEKQKKLLEELTEELPHRYYLWAYLGRILRSEKRYEEAIMVYQKALALEAPKEDRAAILSYMVEIFLEKGEYRKAIDTAIVALEIVELPELYNLLGRAYYKMKDYYNAMEAFLRATELNPASAIDYANVGYCLKALNQLGAAEVFFRKALQLDPNLTMAKRGLQYCESYLNTQN